ncbi:MAG: hypothetical protein DRN54_04630 [Thaumarchaeota archaeon]|nr:MAG: hypothetical protein DRN54_04630 [Nitrososphaerota archaeon]
MRLKIIKEGNRITYILARENENIPLLTVENGEIRIEKVRLVDYEVSLTLIAALRHAVTRHVPPNPPQEPIYQGCLIAHFFWCFERERLREEAGEALRRDE